MTERNSVMREYVNARHKDGGIADRFSRRQFLATLISSAAALAIAGPYVASVRSARREDVWTETVERFLFENRHQGPYKYDEGVTFGRRFSNEDTVDEFPDLNFIWVG